MPPPQQPSRRGSVQEAFVQVREIAHNVLCLTSPDRPTQREYRAILEVSSTNYTLKSEEEQDLMIAGYRAFLKALAFPIQILVRSQELDLSPYVQHLEETAAQSAADPMWRSHTASISFSRQTRVPGPGSQRWRTCGLLDASGHASVSKPRPWKKRSSNSICEQRW